MLYGDWTDAEKFTIADGYVVLRNTGSYASAAMSGITIEDYIDMKATSLPIVFDYAKKTSLKPPSALPMAIRSPRRRTTVVKYTRRYYRQVIKEFYNTPFTYTRRSHDEINCAFCGCLHTEDGYECGDCVIARTTAVDFTLKWAAETHNVLKLFWLADLIRHRFLKKSSSKNATR